MGEALGRRLPVELTADRAMSRRVRRLGIVSLFALGLIWGLAVTSLDVPWVVGAALAAGWVLMPAGGFPLKLPLARSAGKFCRPFACNRTESAI